MIFLVLGTPDSGKSAKAEALTMELSGDGKRYYIATMIPFGQEGEKRVLKHRKMREGKGFETIECPVKVHEIIYKLESANESTCLLECMSNLIGNEMHLPGQEMDDKEITEYIVDSVMTVSRAVKNLVIVANLFPLDGEGYDEDTKRYVTVVDMVNKELKKRVDKVYELV